MKKYLYILVLFLAFTLPIIAQESNTLIMDNGDQFKPFPVNVYTQGQSAWDKSVPIYVQFTATKTSQTVQINWDAPSGVQIISKYPKFISVVAGQTYTYKAKIVPEVGGTYNIAANVILWESKTNYTSSSNTTIVFQDNLLTDPVATEYTTGIAIKWVVLILAIGISSYLGYIYFIKSKKKFDKWFNLPD